LLAVTYPVTGKRYQYGFDSRGLPSTLTNTTDSVTVVTSVSYGVAGEMTTFVSGGGTEGRSYNVNGQMTTLTLPGRTITYNFPAAGSNNGKVSSVVDSGETISYAYDALQRLISATGSDWSQTYAYDGFGNMTGKVGTGGAPSWSNGMDPATNRLSGVSFDANGNQLTLPMTSGMPDTFAATYDASNRMIYVENPTQSRRTWYEYDAGNKRVYEKRVDGSTQEWFHYFGITGQRLARYSFTVSGAVITFAEHENSVWFGGKLVKNAGSWTNEDRLGSVGKYLPYGEDKPGASGNPANDSVKFATYTRDAGTGIDYADQRWHAQGVGRFLTSDPYQASAGAEDPGSWNRYGYVQGDPANYGDASGMARCYMVGGNLTNHTATVQCTSNSLQVTPYWYYWDEFTVDFHGDPTKPADVDELTQRVANGPIGRFVDQVGFQYSVRQYANSAIDMLPDNCMGAIQSILPGVSNVAQFLRNYSSFAGYTDGMQSYIADLPMTYYGYGFSQTAGSFLASSEAAAFTNSIGTSPSGDSIAGLVIVFGRLFWEHDLAGRNVLLIHELLHVSTGLGDRDLADALGLSYAETVPGEGLGSAASGAISRFLLSGCNR
jgi:RHS repeat-associated protein